MRPETHPPGLDGHRSAAGLGVQLHPAEVGTPPGSPGPGENIPALPPQALNFKSAIFSC